MIQIGDDIKLAVIFHRFGPYHHARLKALSKYFNLVGIECSGRDDTYDWEKVNVETIFEKVTLLDNSDIDNLDKSTVSTLIINCLDKIKPEAVAIPGWSANYAIAAMSWCTENNVPIIVMSASGKSDFKRNILKEAVKKELLKNASSVLVGGSEHKDYILSLNVSENSIFQGYNAVDNDHFSSMSLRVKENADEYHKLYKLPKKYFLTSNRFIPKKNLFRLIDAYKSYYDIKGGEALDLLLLGDGELKDKLLMRVEEIDLSHKIHFVGFKQYHELPIYYALASFYIHTSTSEQWGLVVNEAMASSLPVLVSERCGCANDLVHHGLNGYKFNPFDTEEITQYILKITSEGGKFFNSLGAASFDIISNWGVENFAKGMRDAVEFALKSPLPKRRMLSDILFKLL